MNESVPTPDTAPGVYEKVMLLLKGERTGKSLDAPSGEGAFSLKLKEAGYKVWAADLNQEKFKAEDITFAKVDLNKELPYEDAFFDLAVCIEGIEHLENPHYLIREFNRTLNKGGVLIITTPNTLNVYSRLRYLLFGSPDRHHSEIESFKGSLYQVLRRHINPIGFPEMKYVLENNGFKIEKIDTNMSVVSYRGGRFILRLFMPLVFLLVGGFIKLIAGSFRKKDSLSGILLTPELLFGDVLILKAKKG
ncbi:MAG: class I SAM-dependent methyltransferase [Candidatus Omnitrophota bacterium]